jgi:hypothetical protein
MKKIIFIGLCTLLLSSVLVYFLGADKVYRLLVQGQPKPTQEQHEIVNQFQLLKGAIADLKKHELAQNIFALNENECASVGSFNSGVEATGYINIPYWEYIVIGEDTLFNDSGKSVEIKYFDYPDLFEQSWNLGGAK